MCKRNKKGQELLPDNNLVNDFVEEHGEAIKSIIKQNKRPVTYPLLSLLLPHFCITSNTTAYAKKYAEADFGKYAKDVSQYVSNMGPLHHFLEKHGVKKHAVKISKDADPALIIHN